MTSQDPIATAFTQPFCGCGWRGLMQAVPAEAEASLRDHLASQPDCESLRQGFVRFEPHTVESLEVASGSGKWRREAVDHLRAIYMKLPGARTDIRNGNFASARADLLAMRAEIGMALAIVETLERTDAQGK